MKTCHFTLDLNQEEVDHRIKNPDLYYPCDFPLIWVCSNCGAQFPPLIKFTQDLKCCPKCHAKVVKQ